MTAATPNIIAGMNARHAARTRKASCFAVTSHHIRALNTTISSRKNAVLCVATRHSGRPAGTVSGTSRHAPHGCARCPRSGAMAVEVGFEPTEGLPLHTLSRRAPSATRRLHRGRAYLTCRYRPAGRAHAPGNAGNAQDYG